MEVAGFLTSGSQGVDFAREASEEFNKDGRSHKPRDKGTEHNVNDPLMLQQRDFCEALFCYLEKQWFYAGRGVFQDRQDRRGGRAY